MSQQEKNDIITHYIRETFLNLKKVCTKDKGLFINKEKYNKVLATFLGTDLDIEEIKLLIDLEKEKTFNSYKKWEEQERLMYLNQFEDNQNYTKKGITLNRQMIELMMITNSNSIDELNKISHDLKIELPEINLSLTDAKKHVFDKYISTLTDRNTYYSNLNSNLSQKIINVVKNLNLTPEEIIKLNTIVNTVLQNKLSISDLSNLIVSNFSKEKSRKIFVELAESRDLEEPGIKNNSFLDWKDLYRKLDDFGSITIDFESKYPAIVMANGEMYFNKLQRCLDFAKKLNKDVRLNALIFFEDCPKKLSDLEYNEQNKRNVYNELLRYVDETTKFIADYNVKSLNENGYEVVKSIDLFNELITRFSNDFDNKYLNREKISNNNFQSGWQKFLNVEDLCEIALVARKNLPNIEFVYNEINLEDINKLPELKNILDRINLFEEKNRERLDGKKIIDCIGTQMHLNPYLELEQIDKSLLILSSFGYPLKITEYDQPLSEEFISSHTEYECFAEKNRKQESLKKYIEANAKKYNIKQATIWSLTDSTNFLLDIKNKEKIANNEPIMQTIYGGAFRKQIEPFKWKSNSEAMVYSQIKQKNQMIKQQKAQQKQMNKPRVKTLTPPSQSGNGIKGFTNIITLSLIVSFVAGALFMVMYMLLNK